MEQNKLKPPTKIKDIFLKRIFRIPFFIYIFLSIVILGGGIYINQIAKHQAKVPAELKKVTSIQAEGAAKSLYEQVSEILDVPDEIPSVGTISNVSKLKNQEFYRNAKDGDKILIFSKEKTAVIYRESEGKIISIAPLSFSDQEQKDLSVEAAQTPTPVVAVAGSTSSPLKIAIYNGTRIEGFARSTEDKLKENLKKPHIVAIKANAKKQNYENTILVPITKEGAEVSVDLERILNGEMGDLPKDEEKPENTDLLIILGKVSDKKN